MKSIFISAIIFFSQVAGAADYYISCGPQGELQEVSYYGNNRSHLICDVYEKSGFACFDTAKATQDSKYIYLGSPIESFYGRKKRSGFYLRKTVEEIITISLKMGVDPYAVLAIVILENPPTPGHQVYANDYGNPPIDNLTFRSMWGCDKKTQLKRPTIALLGKGQKGRKALVCELSPETAKKWESPLLQINPESPTNCCAYVYHREGDDYTLSRKVKSQMALTYIKKYFATVMATKLYKSAPDENTKLALLFQAYNGLGKVGVAEKLPNSCLSGIDMGMTPVYGAGVADIMMNFLIGNSEIRAMVSQASDSYPVHSYLCQIYKEGIHKVDALAFSLMQYRFLKNRPECGPLQYDYSGIKSLQTSERFFE